MGLGGGVQIRHCIPLSEERGASGNGPGKSELNKNCNARFIDEIRCGTKVRNFMKNINLSRGGGGFAKF